MRSYSLFLKNMLNNIYIWYWYDKLFSPPVMFTMVNRLHNTKNLSDFIVDYMLAKIHNGLEDGEAPVELVEEVAVKLGTYGTPQACLLAIHLSNYTGVKYSEKTNEVLRHAACEFKCKPFLLLDRTIEIVRGKYF